MLQEVKGFAITLEVTGKDDYCERRSIIRVVRFSISWLVANRKARENKMTFELGGIRCLKSRTILH